MAQAGLRRWGRTAAMAGLLAVLCACSSETGGGATEIGGLPRLNVVPGSLLLPPAGPRPLLRDTCGAAALAGLVGRPRTQIPVAVDLSRRRVTCTACPVAPDIRLDRLNILYDAQTGLVTKITCG